jgi:succinate dehydrogenase/fumarate reductase flavoprotein subunit
MIVVRNRFVAKPGCAGKLAAQLKEAAAAFEMPNARVLTDVTGEFNQVVMEFTAENMAEIEKRMQETMGSPKYRERMAGYTELWITVSSEIFRIV